MNIDYKTVFDNWKKHVAPNSDLAQDLYQMEEDETLLAERFSRALSFGTAGLRGVLGAGTNAMNIYTVRQAVQGIASYLCSHAENRSAVIAFDSRIQSDLFAVEAARVLAANGVKVFLFDKLAPTPVLSFAVRHLKTTSGLMITASHNPAIYNGLKVYDTDGGQIGDLVANKMLALISPLDPFSDILLADFDDAVAKGDIQYVNDALLKAYYFAVTSESYLQKAGGLGTRLKVAFTPLNGTGFEPVIDVLKNIGITDIHTVKEQAYPDGNFPTTPYPNPEFPEALALGIKLAQKEGCPLLIATDPDADRLGVVLLDKNGLTKQLTGNEVGALLFHYVTTMRMMQGRMPRRPVAVRSIVSSPLIDRIAQANNVEIHEVLTGFKNVAEYIHTLEKEDRIQDYIFGYEEACGYLCGTYVRDKDAVSASMLFCEMAAFYKSNGRTIQNILDELYETFGYFYHPTDNYTYEGLSGTEKINSIMESLRTNHPTELGETPVISILDYQIGKRFSDNSEEDIPLPKSNVLVCFLENGDKITFRPSGTEPKIKFYYSIEVPFHEQDLAEKRHLTYQEDLEKRLSL